MRAAWLVLVCLVLGSALPPDVSTAKTVRNLILCIGDGMGIASVTGARILAGELGGLDHPAAASLFIDTFPYTALSRTHSLDGIVTDSAAGMTALVCGEKTRDGWLGIVPAAGGIPERRLRTILEMAEAGGKATGVVTTTSVTHATPAACYAHVEDRDAELSIARQLLPEDEMYNHDIGDGLEVVLGGGRTFFVPKKGRGGRDFLDEEGGRGARKDGRDLREDFRKAGYTFVWNRDGLAAVDPMKTSRLLGLFASDHMSFEDERAASRGGEPSLSEMVEKAIGILVRDPDGFFLMIEGGRIDHALHACQGLRALQETLAFDAAVRTAASLLDPEETLILVTSDHDHTMTIAGYPSAGVGVRGFGGKDKEGRPYPVLLFGTGPGWEGCERRQVSTDQLADPRHKDPSAVPMGGGTHGGMDVPIYAWGVRAYAERVHGTVENTAVFGYLRDALEGR